MFAPDGARFDSAGTLRNQMMRYFGYHGAINIWQPGDRFTGQRRREDQDGPDGMREAEAQRVQVVETRGFHEDSMHDIQGDATSRELLADTLGAVTA